MIKGIRTVDLDKTDQRSFSIHLADCVILTYNNKILMQQRPLSWGKFGGNLNIFGGHIEEGETVIQALIRELNEETGAEVLADDVIFIGAVSEDFTNHTELVHVHFWHDKHDTITGCYEAEAVEYDSVDQTLAHPQIMEYAQWALLECRNRNLIT